MMFKFRLLASALILVLATSAETSAEDRLRLATTTSTDNSGLLAVINPFFEANNNIKVDVIAVGTGKALRLAENGDVDLVLVHAPSAELAFIDSGFGVERRPVMHNDFILLGAKNDPAGIARANSISDAMLRISLNKTDFVSRGDDSGTHKKELSLWQNAGIKPEGNWYISAGQGMGAVLRIADDKNAYTLCDRGTYLALKQKLSLVPLFQGAPMLFNPYHVIAVNPARHAHVQHALAGRYIEFLTGPVGQKLIADFRVGGEILFYPDAMPVLHDE